MNALNPSTGLDTLFPIAVETESVNEETVITKVQAPNVLIAQKYTGKHAAFVAIANSVIITAAIVILAGSVYQIVK